MASIIPKILSNTNEVSQSVLANRPVLIMGQSNIAGRNAIADLPEDISIPLENAYYYAGGKMLNYNPTDTFWLVDQADSWAADTPLLKRLADYIGNNIYACKLADGGTSFYSPNVKGVWNIDAINGLADNFFRRIRNLKSFIETKESRDFNPVCLWCDIGESDSATSNSVLFKSQFKDFIRTVRNIVEKPYLPIIHRKLQLNQSGVAQWFLDAQEDFAAGEITNYFLIRRTFTLQDSYHLDAASSNVYASDVLELIKKMY